MATTITSECINCGACEPECPNNAISQGDPIYVIDPLLCTECVGFHDYEACAAVCPVDCCVPDPNNIESEEVLIARARTLHKETDFGENFQSRFRKGQAAPAAAATAQPGAVQASAASAPVAPKVAAPVRPVAAPVVAKAPAQPVAAKPAPQAKKEIPSKKTFEKELPVSFEEISDQYKSGDSLSRGLGKTLVILAQPALGALSHDMKKRLEAAVQSPLFTAAGSTGLNIVHNTVLYPLACIVFAVIFHGPTILFSRDINNYVLIGILLAVAEGVFRLKDGIFGAKPAEQMRFPASVYGPPLGMALQPLFAQRPGVIRDLPIPVDGFYSKGFVEKLERERRYGNVYTLEDRGGALLLQMEFPRWIPDIGLAAMMQLPVEMPDYDYDLLLNNGQLIVKGKCTDERVRKISSSVGAFPPEFTTIVPLREKVVGFAHHFENKLLRVFLLKDKVGHGERGYR